MTMNRLAIFYIWAVVSVVKAKTMIFTFSDTECLIVSESLIGEYMSPGSCTDLSQQAASAYSSFMVNSVGAGYLVTIYAGYTNDSNDQICSETMKSIAESVNCYDTSWEYYSVDDYTPPTRSSLPDSDRLVVSPSLSSPLASGTSTSSPSTSSQTTSSPAAPPPTSPETQTKPSGNVDLGAAIGGTAAGTLVLVLAIMAAVFYYWLRPRWMKESAYNERAAASGIILRDTAMNYQHDTISEAPWQSERPYELSPEHIVEAPT
ncbi:hypothetical protein F5B20DRAFT_215659 [Whalleya microplaca]|nr:hypothetical protein F5B20DRAFT_215659 [Whalleya microplaca]